VNEAPRPELNQLLEAYRHARAALKKHGIDLQIDIRVRPLKKQKRPAGTRG
jgi:hypothetical protein